MWYNINFYKWAVELLPTQRRKPKMIAYLKSMLAPVVALHDEFLYQRSEDLFKLNHNGQVCYLRKALNDKFDSILRRIEIDNGNQFQRKYIYTRAEQKPQFLGVMYLHSKTDFADTGVDFIIYIPTDILNVLEPQIKALVDYFKKATKRYKFVGI